jgi:ribosomal protein S6
MNEKDSNVGNPSHASVKEQSAHVGSEKSEQKVYEVSALFVPELEGSELNQTIEALKTKLTGLEAEIISEGKPVYLKLAYTVEKHINNKIRRADNAFFYWVKFAISPANIAAIETYFKLDLNEKALRHLLIKTVRENTVLTELTEAKIADAKNDELIEEVIASDLKEEGEGAITDLGGDKPLKEEDTEVK